MCTIVTVILRKHYHLSEHISRHSVTLDAFKASSDLFIAPSRLSVFDQFEDCFFDAVRDGR